MSLPIYSMELSATKRGGTSQTIHGLTATHLTILRVIPQHTRDVIMVACLSRATRDMRRRMEYRETMVSSRFAKV